MGNDNTLMIVVLAVIAFFVLTSKTWIGTAKGAISGISAIASDPCSGYAFNPILYGICRLANPQTPATTADGTPSYSPQTPSPTIKSAMDAYNRSAQAVDEYRSQPYGSDAGSPSSVGYASANAPGAMPDVLGVFDEIPIDKPLSDYYYNSFEDRWLPKDPYADVGSIDWGLSGG